MTKSILILTAAALAGSLQIVAAGDITGKVTLKGTPPAEKPIAFDETCGNMHPTTTTTRWYVVGKDNGLPNVFVYISKGLEGKKFTPPATPVQLVQERCMYQPYVLGAMTGQMIQIKNNDPILHNVHALPTVDGNQEFNFAQVTQGQVNEKSFPNQEVLVKFKCDVHQWMFAYVGVVSNPYFAVTDADGNFKISGVPAGEYTLTAYHLKTHGKTTGESQAIKVEGDKPLTADFTVEVKPAQ